MKCLVCDSPLPFEPQFRTTDPDDLTVIRHYLCRNCNVYTRVPSKVVAQEPERLNTVPLAVLVRRKSREEVAQQAEYRRGYRDGLATVMLALQELVDMDGCTFSQAYQLLWHYWRRDLADWQHSRPGEVVAPPALPLPAVKQRLRNG